MEYIPALPGGYVVQYYLNATHVLKVGQLGKFWMPRGDYFYMGSARGPGGLRARIIHHIRRRPTRNHWHIDRLSPVAVPQAIYYLLDSANQHMNETNDATMAVECIWSQALAVLHGASIPAPGFGSSDCKARCSAHLIAFAGDNDPIMDPIEIRRQLARAVNIPSDTIVHSNIHEIPENLTS